MPSALSYHHAAGMAVCMTVLIYLCITILGGCTLSSWQMKKLSHSRKGKQSGNQISAARVLLIVSLAGVVRLVVARLKLVEHGHDAMAGIWFSLNPAFWLLQLPMVEAQDCGMCALAAGRGSIQPDSFAAFTMLSIGVFLGTLPYLACVAGMIFLWKRTVIAKPKGSAIEHCGRYH